MILEHLKKKMKAINTKRVNYMNEMSSNLLSSQQSRKWNGEITVECAMNTAHVSYLHFDQHYDHLMIADEHLNKN